MYVYYLIKTATGCGAISSPSGDDRVTKSACILHSTISHVRNCHIVRLLDIRKRLGMGNLSQVTNVTGSKSFMSQSMDGMSQNIIVTNRPYIFVDIAPFV